MSEPEEIAQLAGNLGRSMGQVQAMMAEAVRQPRFRYIRVTWEHVNARAAEGYQLAAIPPHPVDTVGKLYYVMGRPLTTADEAAAVLEHPAGEHAPYHLEPRPDHPECGDCGGCLACRVHWRDGDWRSLEVNP